MSEALTPSSFRTDHIDAAPVAPLIAILDKQAELPGIRRLRHWAVDAMTPKPGDAALDVGSGTGSETCILAQLVGPNGSAVGVEPNHSVRSVAVSRATEAGSHAQFVDGDVYQLAFDDSTFDVVRCERVFQHLHDPAAAAREIARVTKPSGCVCIIDTDWATTIFHPVDPNVARAITEVNAANTANPHAGRTIAGQLTAAGLTVIESGSEAVSPSAEDVGGPILDVLCGPAVAAGAITDEQAAKFRADLVAGARRGDFHMSVTMFAVIARKPD